MCLATDLRMGFPFEHGLHATLTTMRLWEALAMDEDTASRTYYACFLMYAGCTVDGLEKSRLFGGSMTEHHTHRQFGSGIGCLTGVARALPSPESSWPRRTFQVMTGLPQAARFVNGHFAALCEVAGMLSARLGLPESVSGMFPLLTERWDGASVKRGERAGRSQSTAASAISIRERTARLRRHGHRRPLVENQPAASSRSLRSSSATFVIWSWSFCEARCLAWMRAARLTTEKSPKGKP